MDPTVIQAVTAVITSIIGGLCVAVPAILNTRKNTAIMEFQMEQLTATVNELKRKLDEIADLKAEIGKITVRLEGIEKDVEELKAL